MAQLVLLFFFWNIRRVFFSAECRVCFQGFQVLVEIDWLDYGHKFGDRCGHQENTDDVSEQCPVFLQWLDCVHQLLKQFPCLFEFNEAFLVGALSAFCSRVTD